MNDDFKAPYPGYDVLAKWHSPSWNEQTRQTIKARLGDVPARRFFTEAEWRTLIAFCETVMPQPERDQPVPIAPFIDADLYTRRGSGTRYADMPDDGDAWRYALAAIDHDAEQRHGQAFHQLALDQRTALLADAAAGNTSSAWGVPSKRFMRDIALQAIVSIYYVHPAAQSEIGFGGPASPRGYVRLGPDRRDGWEAALGTWRDGGSP